VTVRRRPLFLFAIASLAALSVAARAQRTDEEAGNVYMAGPEVRPAAAIGGDLVATAGRAAAAAGVSIGKLRIVPTEHSHAAADAAVVLAREGRVECLRIPSTLDAAALCRMADRGQITGAASRAASAAVACLWARHGGKRGP